MEKEELNIISSKINKLVEDFCKIKFKPSKFVPGETPIPCTGKVIDSSEIKKDVGWEAEIGWEEGLKEMVDWGEKYFDQLKDWPTSYTMRG